jgi:glycosyltransferase involved in cell wall biosynthesis
MITDNLMKGGKERRLIELLRFFDTLQIRVMLVILKDQIEYPVVHQLKNTKLVVLNRKIKKDPFIFFKLISICHQFKPDIIHSWGSMPSIYVIPAKIFLRIPFINAMIVNAKCDRSEHIRSFISFPFSDVILANSFAGLKAYKVSKQKGKVIYNGFNFDRTQNLASNTQILEKYNLQTQFIVGMVAAFHPRKDFATYLAVADEISKERNDVTFLAVGEGELKQNLEKTYSNNNRIIFTGNVGNVEALMNVFDVGVLLSNSQNHLEGISNSILEMMALAKPVIASKGGGTDEIVLHQKTGVLIEPFAHAQLKENIIKLLDSENERVMLGNQAKKHIAENFSIEQMCQNTFQLYQATLNP